MKRLVWIILTLVPFFMRTYIVTGQNDIYNFKYQAETNIVTHVYGPSTEFLTNHIVSDYGKRLKQTSSWHRGVDFNRGANTDHWDHFLALNKCDVKKLQGGAGYKYILTQGTQLGRLDHFGYGHLFDYSPAPNAKGDLVLIEMDNIIPKQYAIIQMPSGPPFTAFGPVEGTATYGTTVYTVTNDIEKDEVLGNIGRSNNLGNYNYQHVHVYMFKDINKAIQTLGHSNISNDRDPLEVISHPNTIYEVTISKDNNVNNNSIVTSSGADAISVRTRYSMQGEPTPLLVGKFKNVVMDIDNVDIFIKAANKPYESNHSNWGNLNSNYQLIRGEFVDSHLSHGARLESEIYPIIANPFFGYNANPLSNTAIDITTDGKYGSYTSTGIDPFAYRETGNQTFDEYYFSDFYTRVKDNYSLGDNHIFASCNEEAMYPDNRYELFSRVISVRDDIYSTKDKPTTEIIIDNFRPFIKKVEIRKDPQGPAIYSRSWEWSGTSYLFQPSPENLDIKTNENLYVRVFTSEPMTDDVSLVINDNAHVGMEASIDKTEWDFTIIDGQLIAGENTLIIDGTDLADHHVLDLPSYIPIRQANNNWLPDPATHTAPDQNHVFEATVAESVDFSATQLGNEERTIRFKDRSTAANISQYIWNFGDGTPVLSSDSPDDVEHYYYVPGIWPVSHTIIINDNPNTTYTVEKNVTVNNLVVPEADFTYSILPTEIRTDNEIKVDFFDLSEGLINSWYWDFGNGRTSSEQNPAGIAFEYNTNYQIDYQIKLIVENAQGHTEIIRHLLFDPSSTPLAGIVDWHETSFYYNFDVSVSNMEEPYLFEIDYGDGTSESRTEENLNWTTFDHQYFGWGEYVVSAQVTGMVDEQEYTALTAKQINLVPWDLTVQLNYSAPTSPPYPGCQETTLSATVYGGNPDFWGTWYMHQVGIPGTYQTFTTGSGSAIEPWTISFAEAGIYKVGLEASSLSGGYGHGEITINVEEAPHFIDAGFYPLEPIRLGTNSTQVFEASIWPEGDPGVPASEHYPTNIRWTLHHGANVIPPIEGSANQVFPFDLFYQVHSIKYEFIDEGEYDLVLETWNDTHGYTGQELDTSCARTLPFYDYEVKHIEVSDDFPFLVITSPVAPTYDIALDANAQPAYITLTNPGQDVMHWTVEKDSGYENNDFFNITSTMNPSISNSAVGFVSLFVTSNNNPGTRFGAVRIRGYDGDGEEVQGSPQVVTITQSGTMGPVEQFVYNSPPVQGENFGTSVAVYDKYAVVGAVRDNGVGSAFILERNNVGIWHVVAALQAADTYNNKFGQSVDIHGEYVIVGAFERAYIFKQPVSGWSGTVNSIASSTNVADYGRKVTIWGDWAVVSGYDWIKILYRNQGGLTDSWGLNHTIEGGAGTRLGYNIDLENDLLAVGVPDVGNGEIRVYNRNLNQPNDWGLEHTIHTPVDGNDYSHAFLGGKGFDLVDQSLLYSYRGAYYNQSLDSRIQYKDADGEWKENLGYAAWAKLWCNNDYISIGDFFSLAGKNCAFHPPHGEPVSITGTVSQEYDVPCFNNAYGNFEYMLGGAVYNRNDGGFQWLPSMYTGLEEPWNTGTMFGFSLDSDYNSLITGGPNKNGSSTNDCGAVVIGDSRNRSFCDVDKEFKFVNFEKPLGNYPELTAFKITLGGKGYPAIIKNGATINYAAQEIILEDGFFAEEGAEFVAESGKCSTGRSTNSPENFDYVNEHSFVEGKAIQLDDFKEIDFLTIRLQNLRKMLIRTHPSFAWSQINFLTEIDQIEVVAKDRTVIAKITNPNPIICFFERKDLPSEYDINIKVGKRTFCIASNSSQSNNFNQ